MNIYTILQAVVILRENLLFTKCAVTVHGRSLENLRWWAFIFIEEGMKPNNGVGCGAHTKNPFVGGMDIFPNNTLLNICKKKC